MPSSEDTRASQQEKIGPQQITSFQQQTSLSISEPNQETSTPVGNYLSVSDRVSMKSLLNSIEDSSDARDIFLPDSVPSNVEPVPAAAANHYPVKESADPDSPANMLWRLPSLQQSLFLDTRPGLNPRSQSRPTSPPKSTSSHPVPLNFMRQPPVGSRSQPNLPNSSVQTQASLLAIRHQMDQARFYKPQFVRSYAPIAPLPRREPMATEEYLSLRYASLPTSPTYSASCAQPPLRNRATQRPPVTRYDSLAPFKQTGSPFTAFMQHARSVLSSDLSPTSKITVGPFTIQLVNHKLWLLFQGTSSENEMIITKKGRCMFPLINYRVSLNPSYVASVEEVDEPDYIFSLMFRQMDPFRYRWRKSGWRSEVVGLTDGKICSSPVLNTSPLKYSELQECFSSVGPQKKEYWRNHGVTFRKIKLTNTCPAEFCPASKDLAMEPSKKSPLPRGDFEDGDDVSEVGSGLGNDSYKFIFESFHKYCPVLRVYVIPKDKKEAAQNYLTNPVFQINNASSSLNPVSYSNELIKVKDGLLEIVGELNRTDVVFPEMAFVAVTHYQNSQINDLKKTLNPHAKGFRNRQVELDHLHHQLAGELKEIGPDCHFRAKCYSANASTYSSPHRKNRAFPGESSHFAESPPVEFDKFSQMKRYKPSPHFDQNMDGQKDPLLSSPRYDENKLPPSPSNENLTDMKDVEVAGLLQRLMKKKHAS